MCCWVLPRRVDSRRSHSCSFSCRKRLMLIASNLGGGSGYQSRSIASPSRDIALLRAEGNPRTPRRTLAVDLRSVQTRATAGAHSASAHDCDAVAFNARFLENAVDELFGRHCGCCSLASKGSWSVTYFSAASRTTQAPPAVQSAPRIRVCSCRQSPVERGRRRPFRVVSWCATSLWSVDLACVFLLSPCVKITAKDQSAG